jgi:DNA-binding transcriptional regulator WhiA
MISQEKSEILGLLCSDGNYRDYETTYSFFDKKRNKSYIRTQRKRIVEFANTDKKLLMTFIGLLDKEYGYRPNITISNHDVFRVCVVKNSVIDDLISSVKMGTLKWSVPKEILSSKKIIKASFIRGFFDGDGSIDFVDDIPRIRICSNNKKGLNQLRNLFIEFDIKSQVNGPYNEKKYELLLRTNSVYRFIKIIGSNHTRKKIIFEKITKC